MTASKLTTLTAAILGGAFPIDAFCAETSSTRSTQRAQQSISVAFDRGFVTARASYPTYNDREPADFRVIASERSDQICVTRYRRRRAQNAYNESDPTREIDWSRVTRVYQETMLDGQKTTKVVIGYLGDFYDFDFQELVLATGVTEAMNTLMTNCKGQGG